MSSWVSIFRSKSYQYQEPAKLAVVSYFQPVFQLMLDVLCFGTLFSMQQLAGMGVVLGCSGVRLWVGLKETKVKRDIKV